MNYQRYNIDSLDMKVANIMSGLDNVGHLLQELIDIKLGNTMNLVNYPEIQQLVKFDPCEIGQMAKVQLGEELKIRRRLCSQNPSPSIGNGIDNSKEIKGLHNCYKVCKQHAESTDQSNTGNSDSLTFDF